MLKQRVITALILIAVLMPALFATPAWPFAALALIAFGTAAWEWARLNGAGAASIPLGVALVALCALAWAAGWATLPPAVVWWIAAAVWVVGGLAVLRFGVAAWPRLPVALRLAVGLLLLWTAWLALIHAKTIGVNFILSTFCLVWAADIAAYFGGRALGRRKLAPAISPGKSWEGVWSGMAGALLVAVVWTLIEPSLVGAESKSLFATLAARLGLAGAALAIVVLVAMSVVGDLFESLVKRSAGAKDSSGLLPGHGGVLDRIDALLPTLPIALALASL